MGSLEQPAEQLQTDLRQPGQGTRGVGQRRRQLVEQLVLEVFLQQRSGRLFADQQAQAQRGAPTAAAFQQCPGRSGIGAAPVQAEQFGDLVGIERQQAAVDLQQLPFQQQPRQVALRPPPARQPPAHPWRGRAQQAIEAGVEGGVGVPWVIVEQQPQRGCVAQPPAQLCFVAVLGQAEGAGQAAAEGRGVQRFPAQRQPDHLHARRRPPRAFSGRTVLPLPAGAQSSRRRHSPRSSGWCKRGRGRCCGGSRGKAAGSSVGSVMAVLLFCRSALPGA